MEVYFPVEFCKFEAARDNGWEFSEKRLRLQKDFHWLYTTSPFTGEWAIKTRTEYIQFHSYCALHLTLWTPNEPDSLHINHEENFAKYLKDLSQHKLYLSSDEAHVQHQNEPDSESDTHRMVFRFSVTCAYH